MQARPPVSSDARSGEDPAPDVLDSGSEREPRLTPAGRRRLRLAGVIVLVSFAAAAGGSELQARRLAGSWQLSADGPYELGLEAHPGRSLSAVMDMQFLLRNDGPREVTVTSASAGGFVLLAPVRIPAQTSRAVVLRQELDCTADTLLPSQPPLEQTTSEPLRWPGSLEVTARTPRGTRTVTIAQPPYETGLSAVMCDRLRSGRTGRLAGLATDPR